VSASKKARQRARRQAARKQQAKKKPSSAGTPPDERGTQPSTGEPAISKKEERLERRETVRQQRIEAARRRQRAKRRKQLLAAVLVAVFIAGTTFFFIARAQQNRSRLTKETEAAGCSGITISEEQSPVHIDAPGTTRTPYNTNPPTSGDHLGGYNPIWDSFDETLEPEKYVHNLEHGGTVIHYKGTSDSDISKMEGLIDKYSDALLIMPDPAIKKPLVITAWRATQTCEKVNTFVIESFIKKQCNKSPEPAAKTCGLAPGAGT
jgi:hypothetical protein